jgi:hypothetical protein
MVQRRSGHPTIPYEPSERTSRYHPSASANARNPAARSPTKGGLPAVANTTRHRKRSATSNDGQERTAQERAEPSRRKYMTRTPTESMMLRESRKVMKVIPRVAEFTRSSRAQTKSR